MATTTSAEPMTVLPAQKNVSDKKQVHPLTSLFAGAVAGAVEATVTYPFEYAKTRSQLRSIGVQQESIFRMLQSVARTEGLSGIYTGCSALIVGTALKAGVRFLAYDTITSQLLDEQGKLSTSRGILAGMAAGAVESLLAVTPTERIKTALIDDAKGAKRFKSSTHAILILLREQGVTGFYRGLVSTTAKQSATTAVRMGSYNALRTRYQIQTGHLPQSSLETFAMGSIAGCITVYMTQPFDTVKTRAQCSQGEPLSRAILGTWQDGGLRSFWRGSTMRLGRLVLSGGIVFTIYEKVLSFF